MMPAAGPLLTSLAADLCFLTERPLGSGAAVVMAADPEWKAGRKLVLPIIGHYAAKAGVKTRNEISACPL
jgi:hypothetical protein